MPNSTSDELEHARGLALTAQTLTIIALITLVIAIVTKGGFTIAHAIFNDSDPWQTRVNEVGLALIKLLPAFLFFSAIDQLRRALAHFGKGDFFTPEAARHVAEAGSYAIYAMVTLMVITPTLIQWVNHEGGFVLHIEPEHIGMLAFALFVSAVGRILAAATDIKTENDAFV